jgi:branched-chain amino acid transport system ATP-binding protein
VAAVLEVSRLRAWYGPIRAVHQVDLTVQAGEIVALLGANGAGKSTTLKAIAGLHTARGGEIRFQGRDVSRFSAEKLVKAGLSLAPEGRRVFGRLTVRENLALGAAVRRGKRRGREVAEDRHRLLELFPILAARLDTAGGTLSGGEQQQLAIARALMSGPRLLLLDEPSLGLAPKLVRRIYELIGTLRAERGVTMLLVEQNVHAALDVADRAYVMQSGRIVLSGTPAELRDRTQIEQAYLGLAAGQASVEKR